MKLNLNCIVCNINQVLRTANILELKAEVREKIMRCLAEVRSTEAASGLHG